MKTLFIILTFSLLSFNSFAQFGPFIDILEDTINQPSTIIPIDFDIDGDVDIVVRELEDVYWYENLGDEGYSVALPLFWLPLVNFDFDILDFDVDGDLDIVMTINEIFDAHGLLIASNLGDQTFEDLFLVYDQFENMTLFEFGDFEGSGDHDLLGVILDDLVLFELFTDEIFEVEETVLASGLGDVLDLIVADVDLDSDLDIFFSSTIDGGKIFFIENIGGRTFGPATIIAEDMGNPSSIYAADIDGDDDLDIVYGAWSLLDGGKVYSIENTGGATFASALLISDVTEGKTIVVLDDLDLDGDNDIVSSSYDDGSIYWHKNNGDATFAAPILLSEDISNINDVVLADRDNDGDKEIFVVGLSPGNLGWFENGALDVTHSEGELFFDENENGIKDELERGLSGATIAADPDVTMSMTTREGKYKMSFLGLPDDDYNIFPELEYWTITSAYDSYIVPYSEDMVFFDTLDFGVIPNEIVDIVNIELTGGVTMRCYDTAVVWLSYKNQGTTYPSGLLKLELDDSLSFISAAIEPDSIVGQNIYWSYEELFFFESNTFAVHVGTPDGIDDTVTSILTTNVIDDGDITFTSVSELTQPIICAYDPNDKTPNPMGEGPEGGIPASTDWIEYTVRFQNTGTDYAEDVIIRDQLDENLIWTSIQPLFSSHDMEFEFDPSGEVGFVFNDIMLLDSNTNEPASHGFVKYRIRMKPDLAIGETIENTAHIYFDFNEAVITNTALNTIVEPKDLGIDSDGNETELIVYPNPTSGTVNVRLSGEQPDGYSVSLMNIMGQEVYKQNNANGDMLSIETGAFEAGVYIISVAYGEHQSLLYTTKLIVE